MGKSAAEMPQVATTGNEQYSRAAQLVLKSRMLCGNATVCARFLRKCIDSTQEGSTDSRPIMRADPTGKEHRYNHPARRLVGFTAAGQILDISWSQDHNSATDDPTSMLRVATADLQAETIHRWDVTRFKNRTGRFTVMLETGDFTNIHMLNRSEDRRPGISLAETLRCSALGDAAVRTCAQVVFDSDRGVLWYPPRSGEQLVLPIEVLITEVNQLTEQSGVTVGGTQEVQSVSMANLYAA